MKDNQNNQEFEELAPHLKGLLDKERRETDVPNNYFQNFEARLQQRLATEQSLEPAAPIQPPSDFGAWWQRLWKPLTALAVPALLLLLWVGGTWTTTPAITADFAELSTQEIDQYIEQNLEDFTEEDLVAMAETAVLEKWQEKIILAPTPTPIPASSKSSFDKALESTQSDDLLEELTTDDLSLEEDWF